MRLDFNVLWVDDQPERIKSQITAIARDMADEGFNFNPTNCKTIAELQGLIADNVFKDEVDLILVDWDLGGGVEGQSAIAEIRGEIKYKDVVFYSAQTAPDKLLELAKEAGVEGVYCATRDSLRDEVVGVFESLVKKVLDLDHTRGIVMGATSDIDHTTHLLLSAMHAKLQGDQQAAMVDEAIKLVEEGLAGLSAKVDELKKTRTMPALLEAHMAFTAYDRLRVLSRALKLDDFKEHLGKRKSVTTYMEKVPKQRNILGHQVLSPEGKPTAVVDSAGKHVSLDEMRALRRLLLELRADFRALLAALGG